MLAYRPLLVVQLLHHQQILLVLLFEYGVRSAHDVSISATVGAVAAAGACGAVPLRREAFVGGGWLWKVVDGR
jgi:hypothetical protein